MFGTQITVHRPIIHNPMKRLPSSAHNGCACQILPIILGLLNVLLIELCTRPRLVGFDGRIKIPYYFPYYQIMKRIHVGLCQPNKTPNEIRLSRQTLYSQAVSLVISFVDC